MTLPSYFPKFYLWYACFITDCRNLHPCSCRKLLQYKEEDDSFNAHEHVIVTACRENNANRAKVNMQRFCVV